MNGFLNIDTPETALLRLLGDENFNADVVRGLRLREPNINLLRIQDIGLRGMDYVISPSRCFGFLCALRFGDS